MQRGVPMDNDSCPTCHGCGLPNGCPGCGKFLEPDDLMSRMNRVCAACGGLGLEGGCPKCGAEYSPPILEI